MIYSDKIKFNHTEYIDPCLCNSWVATAIVGGGIIGAGASIYGANKAANAQTSAANQAAQISREMFEKTSGYLAPYRGIGEYATGEMRKRLSELTTPISVNPEDFKNSEYYKFLETQGLKQTQNSAAMRGLGKSGAAVKGAETFLKGLNSSEWINNFNMQNTNQSNAYNRLKGLIEIGGNAAAGTGNAGMTSAGQQGNALIGAGNAQAAMWNGVGGAITNVSNNLAGYAMYKGLFGNKGNA